MADQTELIRAGAAAFESPPGAVRPRRHGLWRELLGHARFTIPAAMVVLICIVAAFPSLFAGWFGHGDPRACVLTDSGLPPSAGHPFGFDIQGCDLYSNVIYGTRASLTIGLLATAVILVIAVVLGSLAGYFGGVVDAVISRVMDVFFGFPVLVGMIVVLETFSVHNVVSVSLVLALFGWPALARVMRAAVLETVNQEYVVAARTIGSSHLRILARHIFPNSIGPVAILASLSIGGIITAESALTFLGVGLRAPAISWGVQLNQAQQYFTTHLHLLVFPAAFLSVTVLSFVLLGDALRDILDPKLR